MQKLICLFIAVCIAGLVHAQETKKIKDSFIRNKGIEADTFTLAPTHYFPVIKKDEYFKKLIKAPTTTGFYKQVDGSITIPMNRMVEPFHDYYSGRFRRHFETIKSWGKNYFDLYDQILPQYGIPPQMKYLSVIESDLNPNCHSWAGAMGPWQLMSYEADRFGLVRNSAVDERRDVYKSTHVACKLMKELYEQFGNWLLVVAAYNGGPNRMKRILRQTGIKDFHKIDYLFPLETRNHVKKFISVHYLVEGNGSIVTLTPDEEAKYTAFILQGNKKNMAADSLAGVETVSLNGYYKSVVIAQQLNMNIVAFNNLNPGFDALVNNTGTGVNLRLPADKMEIFRAKRLEILRLCVQENFKKKSE
jgi:membrane-bound lytic murein transglycosylase D